MKKITDRAVRQILAALISIVMLATVAMAAPWELEKGQIIITKEEGQDQIVSQEGSGREEKDPNPVITGTHQQVKPSYSGSTDPSEPAIVVNTSGNAVAEMTLDGAEAINHGSYAGAIEVAGSKVKITVENESTVSGSIGGIHVTTGEVTLEAGQKGNGALNLSTGIGAAIGSGCGEDMSGKITIDGVTIKEPLYCREVIGSGENGGSMTGQITITKDSNLGQNVLVGHGDGQKEADPAALKDPNRGSITIEKGATVGGVEIQNHQDADGVLNCYVQTGKNDPETMDHINVNIQTSAQPSAQPAPAEEEEKKAPGEVFWVLSDGAAVPYEGIREDGVLTIKADYANAEFCCSVFGLKNLEQEGIHAIAFKTLNAESRFQLAEVMEGRSGGALMKLNHTGSEKTMTMGEEDLSNLLN